MITSPLKKLFVVLVLSMPFAYVMAEEAISAKQFLYRVRHPSARSSWASMDGSVFHRRRGQDTISAPLYLGILFSPERTLAQIVIDNKQGYYVGQTYAVGKSGTSVIPMNKATKTAPILGKYGLRPQDLTMTFLYWKFIKELTGDSVKGIDCRVMLLQSPDKKETIKAFISKKYYFPLKVEWFKDKSPEAFRTLEVTSFKKMNNYWLVNKLGLYGPGWRTKVIFDKTDVGSPQKGVPPKVFRKLPDSKK
jgi:hypothetical protein